MEADNAPNSAGHLLDDISFDFTGSSSINYNEDEDSLMFEDENLESINGKVVDSTVQDVLMAERSPELASSPPATTGVAEPQVLEDQILALKTIFAQYPTEKVPIILVHGDYHSPEIWMKKPDGGAGWALKLSELGHDVHIVDLNLTLCANADLRPQGISRQVVQDTLTCTSTRHRTDTCAWTMCKLHDKWPGSGKIDDSTFERYYDSLRHIYLDKGSRQTHAQYTLIRILAKVGKAVVIGEGTGAQAAWLAADAVPELVVGVMAIEPLGVPFGTPSCKTNGVIEFSRDTAFQPGVREYGLTDIPLTFDPPLPQVGVGLGLDPSSESYQPILNIEEVSVIVRHGQIKIWLQSTSELECNTMTKKCRDRVGIRQLSQLKKVKHMVVTSHTSSHAVFEFATFSFMKQAGLEPVWKQLKQEGIIGNGRLMFLETNSDSIAVKISG